jgi:hypothetical protein
VFPERRDDFPYWGRIKAIRDAVAKGEAWTIQRVLAVENRRIMGSDEYAWTWAWCAFLSGRHESGFRSLSNYIKGDDTKEFESMIQVAFVMEGGLLDMEWQSFIGELDYGGFDFRRMKVQIADESPATIDADLGWQATNHRLIAGKTYRISARGRYRVVDGDEPWMSEPGGITITYHDGKPLGMLLGAFPGRSINEEGSFCRPIGIGLESTITPDRDSWLFLRLNDSPNQLADNQGQLTIEVEEVDGPTPSPHP